MKRNQIIIIGAVVLFFTLLFLVVVFNKKENTKEVKSADNEVYVPVRIVENHEQTVDLVSYGQMTPNAQIDVAFEVQGKLLSGAKYLKPGMKFNKGEMLYKVDNQEAFYTLSARKTQLANVLVNAMPDIELDFPNEKEKWSLFLQEIKPNQYLPNLPETKSAKERMFLTTRGFLTEYYNIKSLESRMDKYVYVAPFSGSVLQTYAEPGAIVNPGARIATIAKTDAFEVKVPISLDWVEKYQRESAVEFVTPEGEMVGYGSLNRMSDVINQQTQSVDAYFDIRPKQNATLYSGMYVNAVIHQKAKKASMTIPRMAVTDGKVGILKDGKIEQRSILVIGSKPDSVMVTGLVNGEKVVLDKVEVEGDVSSKIFKGIAR